jgi:hypothetical protein
MVHSVEFVLASGTEPVLANCAVIQWDEAEVEIDLASSAPRVAPGTPVLIRPSSTAAAKEAERDRQASGSQRAWRRGTVTGAEGRRVTIAIERVQPRDLRYWPRMIGGIGLGYAIVAKDRWELVAKRWLAWSEQPTEAAFFEPDPLMDFSAGGFRFDDVDRCHVDDRMLLKIKVPTSETVWRATARVVRVAPIPLEEREEPEGDEPARTHRVAIEFTSVPSGAVEALVAFTERLLDSQDLRLRKSV